MIALLRYFLADRTHRESQALLKIDEIYRRFAFRVMIAITAGYGLIYMCRLAIGVVKSR